MKKLITLFGLTLFLMTPQVRAQRNVIFYIGDGFGLAAKTAARMAMGQGTDGKRFTNDPSFRILALDNLKYNATVTTHSLNSWITDSAPGASVYACGENGKQDNEVISLDPSTGVPIETILENAKKNGYAVGLVTTTRITHATPAAFGSHIWYRDLEDYIAAQYMASTQNEYKAIFNSSPVDAYKYDPSRDWELPLPKRGVEIDVLLGGGARHFLPKSTESPNAVLRDRTGAPLKNLQGAQLSFGKGKRADNVDLIEFAKSTQNYVYVNTRDALLSLNPAQFTGDKKLLGLFNASHMNYEQDRQLNADWEPSLADMVEIAIKILFVKSKKGFFLVVEGGRIDHLGHANTGGLSVTENNQYNVDSDKPVYVGGGESIYTATSTTPRTSPAIYGSDYLIKEVLAFDYAVAAGREFLHSGEGKTLIFSTSDHECGGMTLVGLHDENDKQGNGTRVRTYAGEIKKSNTAESGYATPSGIIRGDGGKNGWFPEYSQKLFQGKLYPEPATPTSKRIVIAYGSNPLTNGNGSKAGGTPGNHTPQDIWVGAEDNTGSHAWRIAGRGLIDNTALTPIAADFLRLPMFKKKPWHLLKEGQEAVLNHEKTDNITEKSFENIDETTPTNVFPVPSDSEVLLTFELKASSSVVVEIYDFQGSKVRIIETGKVYSPGKHQISLDAEILPQGVYNAVITVNGKVVNKKIVKI